MVFVAPPATHANKNWVNRQENYFVKLFLSVYFTVKGTFILYTCDYYFQIHKLIVNILANVLHI